MPARYKSVGSVTYQSHMLHRILRLHFETVSEMDINGLSVICQCYLAMLTVIFGIFCEYFMGLSRMQTPITVNRLIEFQAVKVVAGSILTSVSPGSIRYGQ